ncbi:DUF881 domain-containing protein [Streptomyces sp. ICBB 8177]|uniref:DUF881 domain-containing protein n=1 Tax=Streptomyces sp. ICBB 8177 TaxID=563922 RepID=UPI000D68526F|nr:DUF881 domain-containing protein [Streptomyces sp. ICBB 8177]PWI45665.1 hypothetical protein CK485_00305 [Streptomyces sp. ICBB 8177]
MSDEETPREGEDLPPRRPLPPEERGAAGSDGNATGRNPDAGRTDEAPADARGDDADHATGRQRLARSLWPPRLTRAQLIVALLLFALGLGLAIQVRTTSDNGVLRGARQEDLVRILSELDARTQRLQDEKRDLDNQRTELRTSSDQAAEARQQTERKSQELGVLAGTVAARGPGITLTIRGGTVASDDLLDTLEELRAAGAEAIQINDVRAVASTYFTDASGGGVQVDGHKVSQPYVFKVIGNPPDLEPALNIPGGVVQTMQKEQATVSVVASQKIVVDALRSAKQPDYARSSGQ